MSTSVIVKSALGGLENLLQQNQEQKAVIEADFIQQLRHQAGMTVSQSSLPTKKDEEWRFTDISQLQQHHFQVATPVELTLNSIDSFILPETDNSILVFVNGFYSPELSNISGLPQGVKIGNLATLSPEKIAPYLGQQPGQTEFFTAFNTVGLTDVAVIWVDAEITVERPVELLFLTVEPQTPIVIQPRVLVVAEKNSSLQLVEYYNVLTENCSGSSGKSSYFTNSVTEIWLQENAQINHTRIQQESGKSFHIGKTAIAQARDSRYTCNEISIGSQFYRHNLEIFQQGEQTQTNLNGLIISADHQVADTHSAIYLNYPYGTTDQLHKCIIDDSAHAIFNGKVFVPKPAQLTNAAQLNRNLLISPKARVNTKPELQITADNVKCSHGATVSQLEADELFYLRSRGLTEENARYLLIDAFATEIIERIPLNSLRQRISQCVACRTVESEQSTVNSKQ
ncbi:FeS assembly protein SufD [Gloeothece citriformis PCC 7424]|uniref:FeS assembly protein SufD n=1 Tax=Gloeothece citriformis (strain PCC 7424) TaxID=65393 RepID=B7KCX0_GLOC7|nr:Fe-S cluster assembly protein SufD [Gloeothece citriformis]ACK73091.1 FeS assembly protein SufD [Gloeothece citriformis PCC 7424]